MSNHNLKYEMILKCFALIKQIFDRCVSWEDPTKWVVLRYPWNKDHSRVFHTLRKLRQVDVVLNRNQLGSDNGEANVFNVFEAHSSSLFDAVGFVCCLRYEILMKDRVTLIAQTGFFSATSQPDVLSNRTPP